MKRQVDVNSTSDMSQLTLRWSVGDWEVVITKSINPNQIINLAWIHHCPRSPVHPQRLLPGASSTGFCVKTMKSIGKYAMHIYACCSILNHPATRNILELYGQKLVIYELQFLSTHRMESTHTHTKKKKNIITHVSCNDFRDVSEWKKHGLTHLSQRSEQLSIGQVLKIQTNWAKQTHIFKCPRASFIQDEKLLDDKDMFLPCWHGSLSFPMDPSHADCVFFLVSSCYQSMNWYTVNQLRARGFQTRAPKVIITLSF